MPPAEAPAGPSGRLFDGEAFGALRRGGRAVRRPRWAAAGRALPWAAAAAALARPGAALAAAAALAGAAVVQALSPRLSARLAAAAVPVVMGSVDAALRDLRTDLLKGLRGRVLDVGCGDAPYLEYARGNPDVELYVCVEPNPGLQGAIRARAGRLGPQSFRVEVAACTLEELPGGAAGYAEGSFDAVIILRRGHKCCASCPTLRRRWRSAAGSSGREGASTSASTSSTETPLRGARCSAPSTPGGAS